MPVSPLYGGASSSSQQYKLALNILNEHFGPVVRDVGAYVLRRGRCTLAEARRNIENEEGHPHKLSQIKEALVILLQHNLLIVAMPTAEESQRVHPRVLLYYQMDLDGVTVRLRFPKFLLRARQLYSEEGQAVLETIMLHGHLPLSQLQSQVESTLQTRRQAAIAAGLLNNTEDEDEEKGNNANSSNSTSTPLMTGAKLQQLIHKMITNHYLVRVVPFDLVTPSPEALTSAGAAAAVRGSRAAANKAAAAAAAEVAARAAEALAIKKRGRRLDTEHENQDDEAVPVEIAMMLPSEEKGGVGKAGGKANGSGGAKKRERKKVDDEGEEEEEEEDEDEDEDEEEEEEGGGGARKTAAARNKKKLKKVDEEEEEEGEGAKSSKKKKLTGAAAVAAAAKKSRLEDIVEEDEDVRQTLAQSAATAAAAAAGLKQGDLSLASLLAAADAVLWKVGLEQFHRDLRHVCCVKFVRQKVNTTAESLVRTILQHSLPLENGDLVDCERSRALSLAELTKQVSLPPNVTVKMYMDVLQNDQVRIVGVEGGGNGAVYSVFLGNICENLKQRTMHNIVRERYSSDAKSSDGDRNARICRVLMDKKFLDQQQLSELAMMSLRETRERLYHMYRDEMITFQEVPRRADHHPNQTFYLWTFNMKEVGEEVVQRMYKGALNLRLRRQKETEEKRDLLANKDNIRDEVEAAHFDQLTMALDRLDQALENLDETLMLFTVF